MRWTPSKMGKKGGATKGPSKVRGDSEYYKAIRAKRKAAPKTLNTTNARVATGAPPPSDPNGFNK
jgi:hypothetical protein